jgi:hypothetical protein
MPPPNGSNLIFQLTVAACLINGVITVTTFALYISTRMTDRSADPYLDEAAQARKLAELDRKESRYQTVHFITLFLFVLFGVLVLIQLSNRLNAAPPGRGYTRSAPGQPPTLLSDKWPGNPNGIPNHLDNIAAHRKLPDIDRLRPEFVLLHKGPGFQRSPLHVQHPDIQIACYIIS